MLQGPPKVSVSARLDKGEASNRHSQHSRWSSRKIPMNRCKFHLSIKSKITIIQIYIYRDQFTFSDELKLKSIGHCSTTNANDYSLHRSTTELLADFVLHRWNSNTRKQHSSQTVQSNALPDTFHFVQCTGDSSMFWECLVYQQTTLRKRRKLWKFRKPVLHTAIESSSCSGLYS